MKSKSVTLMDIAKSLDVSVVTVSKALRGHPDISKNTARLVKKTAEEMGYSPNFMARNLSSKKTYTIGLVVPKIAHYFFGAVIEAVYDKAIQNNYEIILMVSQENAKQEKKHLQTLMSMRVDGIIISITQETKDPDIFYRVKKMGIPLLFMDRCLQLSGFSTVTVDDQKGAFLAIEHAIKLGYKKIGHLAGYRDINIGNRRYQGFVDAMKKYNIPIHSQWIIERGFGKKDGYLSFMELYERGNLPEFLFTVTYPVALGVYTAAHELGVRIPEDIDIICFGNSDIHQFITPPLSCVDQSTSKLGQKAVDLILNEINEMENYQEQHFELPTKLIIRGTCVAKFNTKQAV